MPSKYQLWQWPVVQTVPCIDAWIASSYLLDALRTLKECGASEVEIRADAQERYTPEPGSRSDEAFNLLANWAATEALR